MGISFDLCVKTAFDKALAWPMATTGLRGLTYAAALMATQDTRSVTASSVWTLIRNRADVGKLLVLTDAIDDAVDGADSVAVATADFSHDQQGICRFLHDRRFVPADYVPTLRSLATSGLISFDNAIGYSNLFCHMLRGRAERQIQIGETHDSLQRSQMVEDNISFAGAFGCFFFGLMKPLDKQEAFLSGTDVHDMLSSAYPDVYALTRATQYLDDLRDIMIDLTDEVSTGTISPNAVLLRAFSREEDYIVLYNFARERGTDVLIDIKDTPKILKTAIVTTGVRFQEEVTNVQSATSRNILESFWRNTTKEGLKTMHHPDVAKKHIIETQRAAALNWS